MKDMAGQEHEEPISPMSNSANNELQIEKDSKSFREKWKNLEYRSKFYHSLCICASFFALGVGAGQLGPTFLDLQILTDTSLDKASAFFTAGSVGSMCGSIVCGIIFSKVNADLLMFLSVFSRGAAAFIIPFCTHYELMIFISFVSSFSGGLFDTGGNALLIRLWGTEGEGLMQFLHFCFAFGGVMSPLFSEPFLAPKIVHHGDESSESMLNTTLDINFTTIAPDLPRTTNVKYAFMITSVLTIILSMPFLFFYFRSRKEKEIRKDEEKRNQRQLPKSLMFLTALMICFFYLIYCCIEDTFASFLMTFLVKEYDTVSKSKGAMATAIYWASFASARLLMVFLCRIFSSLQLLAICISLMIITFTCFFISAHFAVINALYVFSALAGLSMSAVFPAGFSWTEAELIKVNGPVSSAMLVSSSVGTMINPLILGYLMEDISNMWFSYLLLAQTVLLGLLFIFLLVFSRCYLNKRYGSSRPNISIEVDESFLDNKAEDGNGKC